MITTSTSSTRSLAQNLWERPIIREALKFICIGLFNFTLSAIIFSIASDRLTNVITDGKMRAVASTSIAFAITVSNAFFLNARFTFRSRGASSGAYLRYGLVNLVGFGLNNLFLLMFLWIITSIRHETFNDLHHHFRIGELMAFFASAVCVFFWNFLMSRFWVFRRADNTPPTLVRAAS